MRIALPVFHTHFNIKRALCHASGSLSPASDPKSGHLEFVMYRVALKTVFSEYFVSLAHFHSTINNPSLMLYNLDTLQCN
jgi:hypothetical protein